MKISCDREQLLHAFQTVAPSRRPAAPSRSCRTSSSTSPADGATLMATDLEVGIRHAVAGVDVQAPGSFVLPVARFGSISARSTDQTLPHRNRRPGHDRPRRAQRVQTARREPRRVSRRRRVHRDKLLRSPGPAAPRADPPHGLRHRQRKQPLRPGRRAARIRRRARSPPSAPTAAAWPRWKAPSAAVGEPAAIEQT